MPVKSTKFSKFSKKGYMPVTWIITMKYALQPRFITFLDNCSSLVRETSFTNCPSQYSIVNT